MPNSGDIYTAKIYFKGTRGECKPRPILVLKDDGVGNCTIVEITSVAPKNPPDYYDTLKEEIKEWKTYGLDEPSYVKCKNVHNVNGLRLVDKIGSMNKDEFERIVDKITECM